MKGICFTEEMFNAVVDGKKTQTRRIVSRLDNPRYKKGDIVYLKEPYLLYDKTGIYHYKYKGGDNTLKFKNKLFMPESAARYYIKIIDVRRERLQDISDADCIKEGIENIYNKNSLHGNIFTRLDLMGKYLMDGMRYQTAQKAYKALIDKINGKGTWERNPYVWVYDFKLCIEK